MLAICWPGRLIRAGGGVIAGVVVIAVAAVAGGLLLVGGAAGPAVAQSGGDGDARPQTAASGYDEAEAQAIDRMLMCPVCPAQTIDQTEVTLAQQMRAQVRELLAGGASRAETLDWFRERYGPGIVAEPPRSGFNLIAWLAPGAVVIIGLAGGVLALRAMRRPAGAGVSGGDGGLPIPGNAAGGGTGSEADADEMLPWLDAVDRELARDGIPMDGIASDDNPSDDNPSGNESPGNEPAGGEAPSNELSGGDAPGTEAPGREPAGGG